MLGVTSSSPVLVSMIAFLMRHILNINNSSIYIIHENNPTFEPEDIAKALQSQQLTYKMIRYERFDQYANTTFEHGSVFISLISERSIGYMLGSFVTTRSSVTSKFICLLARPEFIFREHHELVLMHIVASKDGGLYFMLWSLYRILHHKVLVPKRFFDETTLIDSIEWLQFLDRTKRSHFRGIQVFGPIFKIIRTISRIQFRIAY